MDELLNNDRVLLLLGGNQGRVRLAADRVVESLRINYEVVRQSSWYESPAWGFDGPPFLNCVVEIAGVSDVMILFDQCQGIEREMGRRRTGTGYANRLMDIDILYHGQRILDSDRLTVPHPRIADRRFTLVPLCEHWGNLIHPVLGQSQFRLLEQCPDNVEVVRLDV